MNSDVFICHASEDKEDFVRPLAEALRSAHVEVWYDEFSLKVGDGLRRSIDAGLLHSRYGIVVLSPSFFNKQWTQRELDGLTARQMSGNSKVILPIWHDISHSEVLQYSPPLADAVAIESREGVKVVCEKLLKVLKPEGSPLIIARDELLRYGIDVPVVTDEWWLDVIEASNKIENGLLYSAPENAVWGRWTFPIPNYGSKGEARGGRLARTAMQMDWEAQADRQKITQITRPEEVHKFISSMPGLFDACKENYQSLAVYAPQLTIRGFAGDFDSDFENILEKSIIEQQDGILCTEGSATGNPPLCHIKVALRHETFGDYEAGSLACHFVEGRVGSAKPKFYESVDYFIWLMSPDSEWLPGNIRDFLIEGMFLWDSWTMELHYKSNKPYSEYGEHFCRALRRANHQKDFKFNKTIKISLQEMIEASLAQISSTTSVEKVFKNFITQDIIGKYYEMKPLRQAWKHRKRCRPTWKSAVTGSEV